MSNNNNNNNNNNLIIIVEYKINFNLICLYYYIETISFKSYRNIQCSIFFPLATFSQCGTNTTFFSTFIFPLFFQVNKSKSISHNPILKLQSSFQLRHRQEDALSPFHSVTRTIRFNQRAEHGRAMRVYTRDARTLSRERERERERERASAAAARPESVEPRVLANQRT